MSNSDSFIDEVAEEVRRDRLFSYVKRYGWIAILAVLLIVGGASYNEWTKARERASAEDLGDAILAAITLEDLVARGAALTEIEAQGPASRAIIDMMASSELLESDPAAAAALLLSVADDAQVQSIYRQIATLKAAMIDGSGLSDAERRERLDGLALGTGVVRLMAEEQIAYMEIAAGDMAGALARLQQVSADAESTPGLRRRATQVIVALGGELVLPEGLNATDLNGADTQSGQ